MTHWAGYLVTYADGATEPYDSYEAAAAAAQRRHPDAWLRRSGDIVLTGAVELRDTRGRPQIDGQAEGPVVAIVRLA